MEKGEFAETKAVLRCRSANGSNESLARLMVILKRENFTGTVTIGITGGSLRTIKAEDRTTIAVDMG